MDVGKPSSNTNRTMSIVYMQSTHTHPSSSCVYNNSIVNIEIESMLTCLVNHLLLFYTYIHVVVVLEDPYLAVMYTFKMTFKNGVIIGYVMGKLCVVRECIASPSEELKKLPLLSSQIA